MMSLKWLESSPIFPTNPVIAAINPDTNDKKMELFDNDIAAEGLIKESDPRIRLSVFSSQHFVL